MCDTLIAFQEKLKNIAASSNDERFALIVPSRTLTLGNPNQEYQSQHKVCVCIEKKEGKIKIAVLETQPTSGIIGLHEGNFLNS